jgi:hypothetical protein
MCTKHEMLIAVEFLIRKSEGNNYNIQMGSKEIKPEDKECAKCNGRAV